MRRLQPDNNFGGGSNLELDTSLVSSHKNEPKSRNDTEETGTVASFHYYEKFEKSFVPASKATLKQVFDIAIIVYLNKVVVTMSWRFGSTMNV